MRHLPFWIALLTVSVSVIVVGGVLVARTHQSAARPVLKATSAKFPGPQSAEHSIVVVPSKIEIDDAQQGEETQGHFAVVNMTDRPMKYRAIAGCACTHLHPDEKELRPHESQPVTFGLRLPDVEGAEKDLSIRVVNPGNAELYGSVHVIARTKMPLIAQPRLVDFGFVRKSQMKDAKVIVDLFDQSGRPITNPVNAHLERGRKGIEVRTVKRKPSGSKIEVVLTADAPIGDLNDRLLVQADGINGTIHLPILGRLVGELCARPTAVFLGTGERQAEGSSGPNFIIARTDSGAPIGQVLDFEPSVKGLRLIDQTTSGLAPFRRVQIEVKDHKALGTTTRLSIRLQGSNERVPLTVVNLPSRHHQETRAATSSSP